MVTAWELHFHLKTRQKLLVFLEVYCKLVPMLRENGAEGLDHGIL